MTMWGNSKYIVANRAGQLFFAKFTCMYFHLHSMPAPLDLMVHGPHGPAAWHELASRCRGQGSHFSPLLQYEVRATIRARIVIVAQRQRQWPRSCCQCHNLSNAARPRSCLAAASPSQITTVIISNTGVNCVCSAMPSPGHGVLGKQAQRQGRHTDSAAPVRQSSDALFHRLRAPACARWPYGPVLSMSAERRLPLCSRVLLPVSPHDVAVIYFCTCRSFVAAFFGVISRSIWMFDL